MPGQRTLMLPFGTSRHLNAKPRLTAHFPLRAGSSGSSSALRGGPLTPGQRGSRTSGRSWRKPRSAAATCPRPAGALHLRIPSSHTLDLNATRAASSWQPADSIASFRVPVIAYCLAAVCAITLPCNYLPLTSITSTQAILAASLEFVSSDLYPCSVLGGNTCRLPVGSGRSHQRPPQRSRASGSPATPRDRSSPRGSPQPPRSPRQRSPLPRDRQRATQERPLAQPPSRRFSEPGLREALPQGDWRRQPGPPHVQQHAGGHASNVASQHSGSSGHGTHTTPSRGPCSADSRLPARQVPVAAAHSPPAPHPGHLTPAHAPPTHVAGMPDGVLQAAPAGVSTAVLAPPPQGAQAHAAGTSPAVADGTGHVLPLSPGPGSSTAAISGTAPEGPNAGRPASAPPWLRGSDRPWPARPPADWAAGAAATSRQDEQTVVSTPSTAGANNRVPGNRRTDGDAAVTLASRAAVPEAPSKPPLEQDKAGPERRRGKHAPSKELQKQVRTDPVLTNYQPRCTPSPSIPKLSSVKHEYVV